jgi:hypothetical protein
MLHDVSFMSTMLRSHQWVKLLRANQPVQVLSAMGCRLERYFVVLSNPFRFAG